MSPTPDPFTHVELTWIEKRIEHWIRFGHDVSEKILDRRRRVLSFAPGSVIAYIRWASNDFGTVVSRIDILRAVHPGEAIVAVSHADPIKAILSNASGAPLDMFQRLSVSPCSVSALLLGPHGPHVLTVSSTASLQELTPS